MRLDQDHSQSTGKGLFNRLIKVTGSSESRESLSRLKNSPFPLRREKLKAHLTESGYNYCNKAHHKSVEDMESVSQASISQNRVLLLNGSTWEPLSIITVPRAITLIVSGKAIVVEETGKFLRTVRDKFPVPSVIALRTYINVPRRRAHWSRKGVLVRDNYTCIYCGVKPGSMVKGKVYGKSDFSIDHIIPRSRGGRDTWTNTACACSACNHRKGNRLPHEVGMKLTWEPKIPRTSYLVIAVGSGPDAWKRYVEY